MKAPQTADEWHQAFLHMRNLAIDVGGLYLELLADLDAGCPSVAERAKERFATLETRLAKFGWQYVCPACGACGASLNWQEESS